MRNLAAWYEQSGDHATSRTFLQQCLRLAEAKRPAHVPPLAGNFKAPLSVSARSFIDYEHESDPRLIDNEIAIIFLHAELGDLERALRMARTRQGPMRNVTLSNLAGHLARQGNVTGAMKLAATFEMAEERLTAIQLIACAVRDGEANK